MLCCKICISPESDYRPPRQGTEHWSNRNKLSTQAWEMYSWIDRPFYSGQETQICRCWTAGRHQKLCMGNKHSWNMVYNSHCRVLHVIACEIECYCMNHQTEMNKLDFWPERPSRIDLHFYRFWEFFHMCAYCRSQKVQHSLWTAELMSAAPDGSFLVLLIMKTVMIYVYSFY